MHNSPRSRCQFTGKLLSANHRVVENLELITWVLTNGVTGRVPFRPPDIDCLRSGANRICGVSQRLLSHIIQEVRGRGAKQRKRNPRNARRVESERAVPPSTPDGTMSFELLIAACSSMVKSKLPLVRAYSQANATDIAVTCSTNTGKACR